MPSRAIWRPGTFKAKAPCRLGSFLQKYGAARLEQACATALDLQVPEYRFVRRYLEREAQPPVSLRQVDPLIRQLTLYRDLIAIRTQEEPPE